MACGGLDPGINVVVREICSTLDFAYNVRRAWGVRYGWRGFTPEVADDWFEITPDCVEEIHKVGAGCRPARVPRFRAPRFTALGLELRV